MYYFLVDSRLLKWTRIILPRIIQVSIHLIFTSPISHHFDWHVIHITQQLSLSLSPASENSPTNIHTFKLKQFPSAAQVYHRNRSTCGENLSGARTFTAPRMPRDGFIRPPRAAYVSAHLLSRRASERCEYKLVIRVGIGILYIYIYNIRFSKYSGMIMWDLTTILLFLFLTQERRYVQKVYNTTRGFCCCTRSFYASAVEAAAAVFLALCAFFFTVPFTEFFVQRCWALVQ